ncbi:unnamed protein product [Polarella glacialis]|uniref:EamA domain-containing protein n=1 Tax=Polarella glacialis TaxID=89957 RepID=A0A813KDP9_POLGL|nr:unnamed protein product [Polarella glacialis]
MQLDAVLAATLGGLLWAFGVLGKRIGVEGASDDSKQIRATITIFLYSLTTTVTPFIDLLRMDRAAVAIPLQDEAWRAQVIFIVMCGLASGLGGVLGTLAFAWAAGANSSLISMVENGCYTLFGAVFISLYFLQNPHISMYVGGALIISGTVVANMGQSCGRTRTDQTKGDSDSDSASDLSESTDEDCSVIVPTRLRKRCVVLAVLAGTCWGLGPLGKKIGVSVAPPGHQHAYTTCTYAAYISCTAVVPLCQLLVANRQKLAESLGDRGFRWQLVGTAVCGFISGIGGLVSTYAFSRASSDGAAIAMIENGVYTMCGALMIALVFKERPSVSQLFSATLVLTGILVSGLAG